MTYQQITKKLLTLLQSHKLIREAREATPQEWIKENGEIEYTCGIFTINRGSLNVGREQVYTVTFFILDKISKEGKFEVQVVSECLQILADIISKLRNDITIDIEDNILYECIRGGKFEDYLAGVQTTFNITTYAEFDACNAPFIN